MTTTIRTIDGNKRIDPTHVTQLSVVERNKNYAAERGDKRPSESYVLRGPYLDAMGVLPGVDIAQLAFHEGNPPTAGLNGWLIEDLVLVLIDRMAQHQSGPFACEENAEALDHLKWAWDQMCLRRARRIQQGTSGTQVTEVDTERFNSRAVWIMRQISSGGVEDKKPPTVNGREYSRAVWDKCCKDASSQQAQSEPISPLPEGNLRGPARRALDKWRQTLGANLRVECIGTLNPEWDCVVYADLPGVSENFDRPFCFVACDDFYDELSVRHIIDKREGLPFQDASFSGMEGEKAKLRVRFKQSQFPYKQTFDGQPVFFGRVTYTDQVQPLNGEFTPEQAQKICQSADSLSVPQQVALRAAFEFDPNTPQHAQIEMASSESVENFAGTVSIVCFGCGKRGVWCQHPATSGVALPNYPEAITCDDCQTKAAMLLAGGDQARVDAEAEAMTDQEEAFAADHAIKVMAEVLEIERRAELPPRQAFETVAQYERRVKVRAEAEAGSFGEQLNAAAMDTVAKKFAQQDDAKRKPPSGLTLVEKSLQWGEDVKDLETFVDRIEGSANRGDVSDVKRVLNWFGQRIRSAHALLDAWDCGVDAAQIGQLSLFVARVDLALKVMALHKG